MATPPVVVDTSKVLDASNYVLRYWLNVGLVVLTGLVVVANVVEQVAGGGAFLGLNDIQWHWFVVIAASLTAVYNAIAHTPPVTATPNAARLQVENQVAELRNTV